MASFLDNTSDIVLDAVLTDYGRQLLAKGDGSFSIVKFAFGDDEIDYSLWNATGSSTQKDLDIMATPILEAFTNNAASMKNKLLTINIENLLYLPVLKLNSTLSPTGSFNSVFNGFVVAIDDLNVGIVNPLTGANNNENGLIGHPRFIAIDQGLDSTDLVKTKSLLTEMPELYEKEYNITIDNRLGFIVVADSNAITPETPVSIDDDNMATYKFSQTVNGSFVSQIAAESSNNSSVINGYQGSRLAFSIKPTLTVQNNNILDRLGEQIDLVSGTPYRTVRSAVTITGVTTGYSLEIPVIFAKKV